MKPLLCVFKPRDIPQFDESLKDLPYDKLWLKYIPMEEARNKARSYFLEHREYTHLVILTDDLITTSETLSLLAQNTQHYNIISGWANGNTTFGFNDTDISQHLPPTPPHKSTYQDYRFMTMEEAREYLYKYGPFIQVLHQGFQPSFIHRKIVEQIPFRTSEGCCSDSCFSLDLAKRGIAQYVNLLCRSYHLKKDDTEWCPLQVGHKKEEIIFQHANESTIINITNH